jgi:hypothetical protein
MKNLMSMIKYDGKGLLWFNKNGEWRKTALEKSNLRKKVKPIILSLALLALSSLAFWFGPRYFYRNFGYLWLKKVENHLTGRQIEDIQKGIQGCKARVVWSSSRTGNHEIYLLNLPDLKLVQLTQNPHVDTFPRFSPGGDKILFCRSQPRWISQRNLEDWDVYLFSLAQGRETLIVKNAFTPQWLTDTRISFVRKNKLIVKNLENGEEQVILDGDRDPIASQMTTPEFFRQNSNYLALTFRGKMDGVFVQDRTKGTLLRIGSGCQITWLPPGQEVIWVDNGGNGGTHLLKSSSAQVQPSLFMDLPGRYSHEYFPRFSSDGKWMVWGATAEGHEPDIEDYEIFLWKVGDPFPKAVRLTYNPANDSWPDIYLEK